MEYELIEVNIKKKDYDILNKYGFMFEKNIQNFLEDIANQLREGEKERRKSND